MAEATDALYLGRALAAARSARGLKRMDLKDKSGVSYPYIAEIENGGKYPSQAILNKLAEGLEMTAFELVSEAERLAAVERGDALVSKFLDVHGSTPMSAIRAANAAGKAVGLGIRSTDPDHDQLVDRIVDQVIHAIEPRVQELLAREVRYAVREELLRQREAR